MEASNTAAALSNVASSHLLATNCIPMGSFVVVPLTSEVAKPHGILIAGCPVTLNGQVLLVLPIDSLSLSITLEPSPSENFILGCGMATVGVHGVIKISTSLKASS